MNTVEAAPRRMGPVATVLGPGDRKEADRIGAGLYRTMHRECLADVLKDLRTRRVGAVLLAAARCGATDLPSAIRMVREFPRVPALLLLTRDGEPSPAEILALGNCGVRTLVDVRTPAGWNRLRETLAFDVSSERETQATAELTANLGGASADFVRLIEALFAGYSGLRTVRSLAIGLGVLPSTLMSRFYRAGLPAPKKYLAFAGLVRAARLFENPGLSIADVSYHLNHSSPQSFGRHIYTYLGVSAGDFRRTHDGARMMHRFREELIVPYGDRIAGLLPLTMRPRGLRKRPALPH